LIHSGDIYLVDQDTEPTETARLSPRGHLRRAIITGTAIVLPVLITVAVVSFIVNFLSQLLNPLVVPIQMGPGDTSVVLSKLIAIVLLFVIILFVGSFTESRIGGDRLKAGLDAAMAQIPGVSSIYKPLDQISTMLLDGDTRNFKDIVLVEFPKEGSYSVAFKTSNPPDQIERATEETDMLTVFMPMGPNPFMGGFILHMAEDEVYPLDLSVEEGISSIVSFGVAVELDEHPPEVPINLDEITEDGS
jgi:uncharacterized membrane protein